MSVRERHEVKARRYREMAAEILADFPAPARSEHAAVVHASTDRNLVPTSADYLAVITAAPDRDWDAHAVSDAMQRAGFPVTFEAARTQLYRMEKRDEIVKHGRGRWRLPSAQQISWSDDQPGRPDQEEAPGG